MFDRFICEAGKEQFIKEMEKDLNLLVNRHIFTYRNLEQIPSNRLKKRLICYKKSLIENHIQKCQVFPL